MKRILFTSLLVMFGFLSINAQSVNGIPFSDVDVEYVRIVGTAKLLSTKVMIQIDFGQETKLFGGAKQTQIRDENDKPVVFNSMIDALNFMGKNGYEFETAYTLTIGNQNVYHYLMRRKQE